MIGVGIIGLGTVGRGTYQILKQYGPLIEQRAGLPIRVVKLAETDPARARAFKNDGIPIVRDARELINDPAVEIVVELIGGTGAAYEYVDAALKKGKWVVTANKALLAEKGDALFNRAEKAGAEIGFEASVCGGIPVIRAIRDGLVGNRIEYLLGILNGTCNYILTRMSEEGIAFEHALKEAQKLGIAESDPTLDISGIDAAHKLCVLVRLAFGVPITMQQIVTRGVSSIEPTDIEFAREFGYKIKLLAIAKERGNMIEARVEPAMIPLQHPMSSVNGVFNAVYVVGDKTGPNLFYGKGAGADPTGSAVVSDIVDMAIRRRAGCLKKGLTAPKGGKNIRKGEKSVSPFYMRFKAHDRPGVLSRVSGILAEYDISIAAVIQKGRREKDHVPIVMLTYEASEGNLRKAREKIDRLPFIGTPSVYLRIEENNL
ncbi:MAG: homoserine dehydrogenase [Deltaproteobacteria bacterium]|jgi:homoserine dehydrogenase|nr:homoserine dehydrogenase [Deltaproteobacteria bacterium]